MCFYVGIILYVHTLMLMPTSRLVFMIFCGSPFKDLRLKCISSSQPSMATSHSATIPGSACRLQSSWTKSGQPAEIIKRQWFTMQLRYIEVVNFSTLLWSCDIDLQDETGRLLLPCRASAKVSRGGAATSLHNNCPRIIFQPGRSIQKTVGVVFFFGFLLFRSLQSAKLQPPGFYCATPTQIWNFHYKRSHAQDETYCLREFIFYKTN